MIRAITESEEKRLTQLERIVDRGKKAFVDVGNALFEIKEKGLWKSKAPSFVAYAEERFGFKKSHAYRLIDAAKTSESFSPIGEKSEEETGPIGPVLLNESHAREVTKVPEELRPQVVERAREITKEQGIKPTAKTFAKAREQVVAGAVPPQSDSPADEQYEDVPDVVDTDPVVTRAKRKVPELIRSLRLQLDNLGLDFDEALNRIEEAAQ